MVGSIPPPRHLLARAAGFWGLRVRREDVVKLKAEQERIERERMGG